MPQITRRACLHDRNLTKHETDKHALGLQQENAVAGIGDTVVIIPVSIADKLRSTGAM